MHQRNQTARLTFSAGKFRGASEYVLNAISSFKSEGHSVDLFGGWG